MPWRRSLAGMLLLSITSCAGEPAPPAGPAATPAAAPPAAAEVARSPVVTDADVPDDIHEDSWARLPQIQREQLDAEGQRAYDIVVNPDSRYADGPRGPIGMWLYSPPVAEHYFRGSTHVRYGTDKDQRLTELIILATAREARSQYEWTSHEPLALQAGLEPGIIDLVKHRRDLDTAGDVPGLGDTERLLIRFAREAMSDEKVSTVTFRQMRDTFGERGVVDIVGLMGHYSLVNLTLKTFDVQLAPGRERLLPDLWSQD